MKRIYLAFLFLLLIKPSFAQQEGIIQLYRTAETLYQQKNYKAYTKVTQQILQQIYSPSLLIKIAKAYQLNGQSDQAKLYLKKLLNINGCARVDTMSEFSTLSQDKQFQKIAKQLKKSCIPIHHAQEAVTLIDATLIPEGITYDAISQRFFIGSLSQNKVIQFTIEGMEQDFITDPSVQLASVLGMKVDTAQQVLWLCSSSEQDKSTEKGGLYGFNLEDGKLFKKVPYAKNENHLLNDLSLIGQSIYVTDSEAGKLYATSPPYEQLKTIDLGFPLVYPNGITAHPSGSYLFIADALGITRLDLQTQKAQRINGNNKTHLNLIDGLYWYKKGLVAIQGVDATHTRIVQFRLDQKMESVKKVMIRQTEHPLFDIPTTGVIIGKVFYFIANSQIRALQTDGTLRNPEQLNPPLIMKVLLK